MNGKRIALSIIGGAAAGLGTFSAWFQVADHQEIGAPFAIFGILAGTGIGLICASFTRS